MVVIIRTKRIMETTTTMIIATRIEINMVLLLLLVISHNL